MREEKEITIIPARQVYGRETGCQRKRLRVAAYCRVSTSLEQQEGSYLSQISYYTEKIKANENWIFVGVYADEGISGTSTEYSTLGEPPIFV